MVLLYAGQQAEIEVHHFGECQPDAGQGDLRQGSYSAMSPSLETGAGYSFGPSCTPSSTPGPGQWPQNREVDNRDNYAELCFSQSKLNGSQPCLAMASEPKVSLLFS